MIALASGAAEGTEEESVKETVQTFVETVTHLNIQFQLAAAATAWDVRLEGFDNVKFIAPLKDLMFVTNPFLYTFEGM